MTETTPITPADIEAKMRDIQGQVDTVAEDGKKKRSAVVAILLLLIIYTLGRNAGKKKSTVRDPPPLMGWMSRLALRWAPVLHRRTRPVMGVRWRVPAVAALRLESERQARGHRSRGSAPGDKILIEHLDITHGEQMKQQKRQAKADKRQAKVDAKVQVAAADAAAAAAVAKKAQKAEARAAKDRGEAGEGRPLGRPQGDQAGPRHRSAPPGPMRRPRRSPQLRRRRPPALRRRRRRPRDRTLTNFGRRPSNDG